MKVMYKFNTNSFLIILMTGLNIVLLYILYEAVINQSANYNFNTKNSKGENTILFTEILLDQYRCEDVALCGETEFIDTENKKVLLKDIVKDNPKFFVRFTGKGCSGCIDNFEKEIKTIKQIFSGNNKEDVIFLFSSENVNELNAFKYSLGITFPLYLVDKGVLPFTVENREDMVSLYYFIMDTEFKSRCFYIPLIGSDNFTEKYYSLLKSRYFN